MNIVFKKLGFGIAILLLMSNCLKELKPLDNGYVNKPVIWCILNCDSTISLISSGNRGMEDDDIVNFKALKIYLFEEGLAVDSLLNQSIYKDTFTHHFHVKAKPNKRYSISIIGFDLKLSSIVTTPNYLLIPKDIELTQGDNAQLTYTLADDPNFSDAYQFMVEVIHQGTLIDTANNDTLNKNYTFMKNYEKYDEPLLNFDFLKLNVTNNTTLTYPVSDNLFNGKDKSFLFTVQNPVSPVFFRLRVPSKGIPIADKMICKKQFVLIKCRKISPDYYKFILSENKNSAIFGTPYFNPTNIYSNVIGGLGLMAAMTERTDTLWIRK
jgi:hypothetical protein